MFQELRTLFSLFFVGRSLKKAGMDPFVCEVVPWCLHKMQRKGEKITPLSTWIYYQEMGGVVLSQEQVQTAAKHCLERFSYGQ